MELFLPSLFATHDAMDAHDRLTYKVALYSFVDNGSFTVWINTTKKDELQKKTRQLYRWMIGSVFRRIESRNPNMTSAGLKVS